MAKSITLKGDNMDKAIENMILDKLNELKKGDDDKLRSKETAVYALLKTCPAFKSVGK